METNQNNQYTKGERMDTLDFPSKTNDELFKIWNSPDEPRERRDQALKEIQSRHVDLSKKDEIAEFIQQSPVEEISIDAVTVISEKPVDVTEQWIGELIASKKLPEEKAIYAYSMGKVVSLFLDLKNTHEQVLQSQEQTQQTLNEMHKKLTKLTEAQASKEEIDKLNFQIQKKENELSLSNQNLTKLQTELQTAQEQIKELSEQLNQNKTEELENIYKAKIEALEKELKTSKEEANELNKKIQSQYNEQDIDELKHSLSEKQKEVSLLSVQIEEKNKELQKLQILNEANLENIENTYKEEIEKLTILYTEQKNNSKNQVEIQELELQIKKLKEEAKANEEILDELCRILDIETYQITINSLESEITKAINLAVGKQKNTTPNTQIGELEEKMVELESKCFALESSYKEKAKLADELKKENEELQIKLTQQPIDVPMEEKDDNPPTASQEEEEKTKTQNLIEVIKKPTIYILSAILIMFILVSSSSFFPQGMQEKISAFKSLLSGDSSDELRGLDSITMPQSEDIDENVEVIPQEEQPQQNINNDTLSQNKPIIEQEQNHFLPNNNDLNIYEEPKKTISAPQVKPQPVNQQQPQVVAQQQTFSPTDYLNSIKVNFIITDSKELQYNGKLYSKGDSFENFTIAYITPAFVIFMDKNNNNAIIRITLP